MSRLGSGADVIPVKAGNNVYTVLLAVAVIVQALTVVAMFMKFFQCLRRLPVHDAVNQYQVRIFSRFRTATDQVGCRSAFGWRD